MDYSQLVESIAESLLDEGKDIYHVTPVENLPSIAKEGLTPNTRGKFNFISRDAKENSKGRLFYSTHPKKAALWQKVLTGKGRGVYMPAVALRVKDAEIKDENPDQLARSRHNKFTRQTVSPEKLDVFHADSGWTPLTAHAPDVLPKLGKDKESKLRLGFKQKAGQQLELFPKILYTEVVNEIASSLLTEIVKVSLAHPTSTNIRYGALFGDIIKKARAEGAELGLKGADKLSVYPIGGAGAELRGPSGSGYKGKDMLVPPTIYASLPNEKTGGIPSTKQSIAHEVGHWLNRDVEDPKKPTDTPLGPQHKLEREVKAVATSRAFARRAGIEMNPEQDQMNLNTYRAGVMREVPLSTEGTKRNAATLDLETKEVIAVHQNKFDIGQKEEVLDTSSRRVVSGKKIYLNPLEHRVGLRLKMLGHRS